MPYNTTLYDHSGTVTYRRSSSAIMLNWRERIYAGTNLQNIAKHIRKIYHAKKGYKLGQVDQSGAEALIMAYLCRDGKFRSLFLNKIKPHVFVALHLFSSDWEKRLNQHTLDIKCNIQEFLNCEIPNLPTLPLWKQLDALIKSSDNWPPEERYYYIAKQVCHSSNYGVGERMFVLNTLEKSEGKIVIEIKKAAQYLAFYHTLFPEIKEYHREIENQLVKTRILYNLFGFPRNFTEEITPKTLKEAYAFIPQSTVGCITAIAFTKLQQFIEDNHLQWDLLADTHDSYLVQAPEDEIMECVKIMKAFMEQPLVSPRGESFQMKAECAIGYNWAPWKAHDNEEGMKEIKI